MFNNVGKTIQNLATVIWYIGIVLAFVFLIVLGTLCIIYDTLILLLLGILGAIIVAFVLWVKCILLHGFGTLIENSKKIANNTAPDINAEASYVPLNEAFENK